MQLDNGTLWDMGQALSPKPLSLAPAPVWQASCSARRCPTALVLVCGAPGDPGRNAASPVEEESSYVLGTVHDLPVPAWLDRAELATSRSAEVSPASLYPIIL